MITIDTRAGLVIATVFGEFTLADFKEFEAAANEALRNAAGKASLLFDLRETLGFTVDVAWEEIKFTRLHKHDFQRIGIVTTDEWTIWSTWIARAFVDAELRAFDDYDMAKNWVMGREEESVVYDLLISTEELAANLSDPDWVICDCRHDLTDIDKGRRAYLESHLPRAHFLHLDTDLSGPKTGKNGRHPLPDPAKLAAKLGSIGIDSKKQVVAYDDAGGPYAARLWWLLRWLGHDAVAVLDGGINTWIKEGRPVTKDVPAPQATEFRPILREGMHADVDFVASHLNDSGTLVVDARAPERFKGITETIDPVAGHIPGAVNRFFRDNLTAEGKFKSPDELRRDFLALLDGRSANRVVNQCGSGVTALHNLLALEIAGLSGSKLYPGSWSEWCADPSRPIARE